MWPHEKCGGMTRFCVGSGGREVGAVRGWLRFEAGGQLVSADSLRAALSSAIKVGDVMMARRASE